MAPSHVVTIGGPMNKLPPPSPHLSDADLKLCITTFEEVIEWLDLNNKVVSTANLLVELQKRLGTKFEIHNAYDLRTTGSARSAFFLMKVEWLIFFSLK